MAVERFGADAAVKVITYWRKGGWEGHAVLGLWTGLGRVGGERVPAEGLEGSSLGVGLIFAGDWAVRKHRLAHDREIGGGCKKGVVWGRRREVEEY